MNRKEIKEFVETLHFHGYIDHDITKLDNLIDDYYPKQSDKDDVIGSLKNRLFDLANDFAVAKQGNIAVKLHSIHNELETT